MRYVINRGFNMSKTKKWSQPKNKQIPKYEKHVVREKYKNFKLVYRCKLHDYHVDIYDSRGFLVNWYHAKTHGEVKSKAHSFINQEV